MRYYLVDASRQGGEEHHGDAAEESVTHGAEYAGGVRRLWSRQRSVTGDPEREQRRRAHGHAELARAEDELIRGADRP